MELWIRSQDKKVLTKCDYFEVNENNEILIYDGCPIAKYKTEKRALEVLDEIQEHLLKMDKDELLKDNIGIINGIKHYGIVYEMPKE